MLGWHKETLYRAVSARPPGGPDQAAAGGIPGAGHDPAQPAPGRLAGHPLAGTSPTPADPEPALLCAPTPATDRQAMRTKSAGIRIRVTPSPMSLSVFGRARSLLRNIRRSGRKGRSVTGLKAAPRSG